MHPSDVILLPPYAGGLLVWPIFWMLSSNRGMLFRELARVFGWTLAGLALLAVGQWLVGLFNFTSVSLLHLFPVVNLFSLMVSTVAFFRASTGRVRLFLERNFIAVVGIPGFSLVVMFLVGGCRDIDIALHEGRAMATVLPRTDGPGRKYIRYSYEVGGLTYGGSGDPGNPPYPPGSTFEIHYCTLHPSMSTARSPLEFIGIICVGAVFAGFGSFVARRSRRTASPKS